jgi:DNA (cytosine-5)-methyltransferase 1
MIGRADKNGPAGSGTNENVSFTLTEADRHGVAYAMPMGKFAVPTKDKSPCLVRTNDRDRVCTVYGIDRAAFNQGKSALYAPQFDKEKSATLVSKGPNAVCTDDGVKYVVRRLTPSECLKLQGLPTDWCDNLGTENPTAEEIEFFSNVWREFGKPKTEKQILKWLKNPYSDSSVYRMTGNGCTVNVLIYILNGIINSEGENV